MSERTLLALINDQVIGTLRQINGLWGFQYSKDWLEMPRGFALSPHLPLQPEPVLDGASLRPVQWYFDNLLPEEGQRTLLAGDARLDAADAFGLLACYGAESAGSLTLLPAGQETPGAGGLRPLSDADLSLRIRQMPKLPLTHAAIKRMSLAGAQHKLAVVLQEGALFEPAGAQPSTHILKPDHPGADYPHSAANEWFVMRLARRLGLEVPEVYRRYVPEPIYLIARFDRVRDGPSWRRRHGVDACQILGLDRGFKYSQGSMTSLAALAGACRSPALARTRLFSWLVFNVLTGNSDAHLKNLSFLVSDEGVQLAPHYDLLSVACYDSPVFGKAGWPKETMLAWPVLGVSRFAQVDRALLLEAGRVLNLAKGTADRLLSHQRERIIQAAETLYGEVQAENEKLLAQQPELSATLAGESRCLRAILHGVIREMVPRLE